MATRRILRITRSARAGNSADQLELGRCHLHGGEGLRRDLPAAYHWLALAADNGQPQGAWLIGEHIPPLAVDRVARALPYYRQASERGSMAAGAVLARWTLDGLFGNVSGREAARHLATLRCAAQTGDLYAQTVVDALAGDAAAGCEEIGRLLRRAERGERAAILGLSGHYWEKGGGDLWHPGQVPGRSIGGRGAVRHAAARLARYWHEMFWDPVSHEMHAVDMRRRGSLLLLDAHPAAARFMEAAAVKGDAIAAYLLGLMYMGAEYVNDLPAVHPRASGLPGRNYKLAANWLEKAANGAVDGPSAEADFALWLLNGLRNYTRRDPLEARRRLDQAASLGHGEACWLKGREVVEAGDLVAAVRFFERAEAVGNSRAGAAIERLAPDIAEPDRKLLYASAGLRRRDPGLALRLELAAYFALAEHEFLLLDPRCADAGTFLLIDVRDLYPRARPRLVKVGSPAQRSLLERAKVSLADTDREQPYAVLKRRFRRQCQRLGIDVSAFLSNGWQCYHLADEAATRPLG